jgi:hypothetical protein
MSIRSNTVRCISHQLLSDVFHTNCYRQFLKHWIWLQIILFILLKNSTNSWLDFWQWMLIPPRYLIKFLQVQWSVFAYLFTPYCVWKMLDWVLFVFLNLFLNRSNCSFTLWEFRRSIEIMLRLRKITRKV